MRPLPTPRFLFVLGLALLACVPALLGQRATLLGYSTPAYVQFSDPVYAVSEKEGTATITVIRSGEYRVSVTVGYASADGTARAPDDYETVAGTLVIPAGVGMVTFIIPIYSDALREGQETVGLRLWSDDNNVLVIGGEATVTITDALSVASVSPPPLTITHAARGQVRLSWASGPTECVLEKAGDAAAGPWQLVAAKPVVDKIQCTVLETTAGEQSFYRLKVP